jgi:O-antigen/teichoic acid export membrane protein
MDLHIGRLTGKALAVAFGRGATVAAQFAVNLLLVRWMPEQFGQFHELRVFVAIALMLELGLPTGVLQFGAGQSPTDREDMQKRAVSLATMLGLIGFAPFAVMGFLTTDPLLTWAFPAAGLLVAMNIPAGVLESVLVVRERHRTAGIVGALTAVGSLCLVVGALMFHPSISTIYAALAAGALVRLGTYSSLARMSLLGRLGSIHRMGELLRVSLGVSLSRLFGMASAWIDRAVVMVFFSTTTLGVYVAGAWEVPFMAIFFGAISSAIIPDMSEHWSSGRASDALAIWKGAISRTAWFVLPIWVWSMAWAPEIVRVFFTDTFVDAVPVFRAYLLMLPLRVAVYSALLVATGNVRILLVGSIIDVGVNIVASIILAPMIGFVGPALATSLGTWVQICFYIIFATRKLNVSVRYILPWRDLLVTGGIATIIMLPTIAARSLGLSAPILISGSAIVGGSVCAMAAYLISGDLFFRRVSRGS